MYPKVIGWIKISLINLMLVAIIGCILRYKIAFSIPFIDQKHLLHGHSHFAFTGWITQVLMALLVNHLSTQKKADQFHQYSWILYANLICAYGMLIGFSIQGYAFFSILFSTLSIMASWIFAIRYWKDLNGLPINNISSYWFKAALLFNAISSIGAFALAYMMANKIIHQNWYLLSVYFFLHFQYNGWFFFACMGLLMNYIVGFNINHHILKKIFWLFAGACFPAYFLSALWLNLSIGNYIIVILAAIIQLIAWYYMAKILYQNRKELTKKVNIITKWVLALSSVALSIKFILQVCSTIPALSELAYGFRPIVIGYLHLILLGVITLFIIGYIMSLQIFSENILIIRGIRIFTLSVVLNEVFLMIQGVTAMNFNEVPFMNELLLITALGLFAGLFFLNLGIHHQKR
jgi:hypothetical protein